MSVERQADYSLCPTLTPLSQPLTKQSSWKSTSYYFTAVSLFSSHGPLYFLTTSSHLPTPCMNALVYKLVIISIAAYFKGATVHSSGVTFPPTLTLLLSNIISTILTLTVFKPHCYCHHSFSHVNYLPCIPIKCEIPVTRRTALHTLDSLSINYTKLAIYIYIPIYAALPLIQSAVGCSVMICMANCQPYIVRVM